MCAISGQFSQVPGTGQKTRSPVTCWALLPHGDFAGRIGELRSASYPQNGSPCWGGVLCHLCGRGRALASEARDPKGFHGHRDWSSNEVWMWQLNRKSCCLFRGGLLIHVIQLKEHTAALKTSLWHIVTCWKKGRLGRWKIYRPNRFSFLQQLLKPVHLTLASC